MEIESMEQFELERAERAYEIIQQAELATRDGYFTRDQFKDMQIFMGLTEVQNERI
jgi:hypothetical protein